MLKTLYAKRNGSSVEIYDEDGSLKATFSKEGYRPTRATKVVTINCWKWNLKWNI